jgi:hypothetical protein
MRRSCALVDGEAQCVMRACLRKHALTAEWVGVIVYVQGGSRSCP